MNLKMVYLLKLTLAF